MMNLPFGMTITSVLVFITCLVALMVILLDHLKSRKTKQLSCGLIEEGRIIAKEPPGPTPFPILGCLYVFRHRAVPYTAFAALVKKYDSQVVKLQMGIVPCVVINGLDNIKEVLFTKGVHFDSRPNFSRYHTLFAGNKENCE